MWWGRVRVQPPSPTRGRERGGWGDRLAGDAARDAEGPADLDQRSGFLATVSFTGRILPAGDDGGYLDLDGPGRSGYCPPRLSRHPHVLGLVPAIRNRPRPVCPRATDRRARLERERRATAESRGGERIEGRSLSADFRFADADRWRFGQGRPSAPGTSVRSLGGTVRGDDQPSRYPPRGVWFGLILAACTVRALAAQEATDAAPRDPGEPLVLSADRVWEWRGADGQYLYLSGHASALQGTDGLRAARAVCRIVNVSTGGDPLYEVEVYAEGDVRHTARSTGPQPSDRAIVRAPLVKMEAYQRDGDQCPALSAASARHPHALRIPGGARTADPPARRPPPGPPRQPLAASPPPVRRRRCLRRWTRSPRTDPPIRGSRPKVDPMVVPAQMTRDRPPGPDDGPDDPGSGPRAAAPRARRRPAGRRRRGQVPRGRRDAAVTGRGLAVPGGRPPPIEGPPGVEVPALPANPQDRAANRRGAPLGRAGRRQPSPDRQAAGRYRRWRSRSSPAASASRSSTPAAGASSTSRRWRRPPRASKSTSSATASGSSPTPPASSGSSTSRPTRPSSGAGPSPRRARACADPTASTSTTPIATPWKSTSRGTSSSARTSGSGPAAATSGPCAHRGSITTSSPTASSRPTPRSTSSRRACWRRCGSSRRGSSSTTSWSSSPTAPSSPRSTPRSAPTTP